MTTMQTAKMKDLRAELRDYEKRFTLKGFIGEEEFNKKGFIKMNGTKQRMIGLLEQVRDLIDIHIKEKARRYAKRVERLDDSKFGVNFKIRKLTNQEIFKTLAYVESYATENNILLRYQIKFRSLDSPKVFYNITNLTDQMKEKMDERYHIDIYDGDSNIIDYIYIYKVTDPNTRRGYNMTNAAFFKYTNPTELNLEKYGCFKTVDKNNYKDGCFVEAAKLKYDSIIVNSIRSLMNRRNLTIANINAIAEMVKINVDIYQYKDDERLKKTQSFKFDNEDSTTLKIANIENHYIILEDTPYTQFFIEHYKEISEYAKTHKKPLSDFYSVNKVIFKFSKKRNENVKYYNTGNKYVCINSFYLLKIMIEENLLEKMDVEDSISIPFNSEFREEMRNFDYDLIINKSDYRPCVPKNMIRRYKKMGFKFNYIIYADCESTTKVDDSEVATSHKAFMLAYQIENLKTNQTEEVKNIFNLDTKLLVKKFLSSIPGNSIIYFHNMRYDYTLLMDFIHVENIVKKDNQYYEIQATYESKKFLIRDSCKMISEKLEKFSKIFKISVKKEIMPYDYYTEERINSPDFKTKKVKVEELIKYLKPHEVEEFRRINPEEINMYDYVKFYCNQDVIVLCKGMQAFRKKVKKALNIDMIEHISISSISDQYMKLQGCYDGTYEIRGVMNMFISRSVVGGRCMTQNNKMVYVKDRIGALDAVSLYPSAISISGYPLGIPSLIGDGFDPYKEENIYYIEIEVNDIHYKQSYTYDFGLFSDRDKNGIINWTNYPEQRNIVVNNYQFNDIVKFYKWTPDYFSIKRGIVFEEGVNNKCQEVIQKMFNLRLIEKEKPAEESLQLVFKLLLNTAYGKTIEKIGDTSFKIINNDSAYNFIRNNYLNIYSSIETSKQTFFEVYTPLDKSYSRPHIGSVILSVSKKIMNDVFYRAHTNNVEIFYQDTDSIHLREKDIHIFDDLIGTNLCQLHQDLESDYITKDSIYSDLFIGLGKKCYIDRLRGKDKDGVEVIDMTTKIKLKAISNAAILKVCEEKNITPIQLYKKMYRGEEVKFDLLTNKVRFQYDKTRVYTKSEFYRTIRFSN